jgi:peptidoglycan/xylan/chitin deacetylase (PgdA/CDA1 family)
MRSRFAPGAVILLYHRVGAGGADPYAMRVSPRNLAEQLEVIGRFARPLHLHDLVARLQAGELPARAVAVTFDDGYADTLEAALPLLERFDVPATVFFAAGCLGQEFWWDELARLQSRRRAARPQPVLASAGVSTPGTQPGAPTTYRQLLDLPADRRANLLAGLRGLGGPAHEAGSRCLTAQEVARLAEHDLISIGAHSMTHPRLPALPVSDQRWEVSASKASLEALTGCPVTAFAYPHGSLSAATRALVREAGYAFACGAAPDVARPGRDLFALPRFWARDAGGDAMQRWLGQWLYQG